MNEKKLGPAEWANEFQSFLSAECEKPPENLSTKIFASIHADLNPDATKVFGKMALIHLIVGTITLLFCPQFGINILPGMGLMSHFMRFGETACMMGCGAIFLGMSTLAASFILGPQEIKVIRRNRLLQVSLLATLSIGVFICFGASTIVSLAIAWLVGSTLGGLATLELGWLVRSSFRRRLVHGI